MFASLPIDHSELAAYHVAARRTRRAGLIGAHLQRRKGQSLEFEEFLPYVAGNDIRHIDWRASLRYRGRNDLLVRHFRAEEQMRLVLSIDDRPTMRLPAQLPKLQLAVWLAEALGWVGLRSDYRVALHQLFGLDGSHDLAEFTKREIGFLQPRLHTLFDTAGTTLNLDPLQRLLPPTAVWLILTDLYFDDPAPLIDRINTAQDGYRIVILIEIDAWSLERNLLGGGVRQVEGPGLLMPDARFDMRETLQLVEQRIDTQRDHFLQQVHGPAFTHLRWRYPATVDSSADLLRQILEQDAIKRLFMRGN